MTAGIAETIERGERMVKAMKKAALYELSPLRDASVKYGDRPTGDCPEKIYQYLKNAVWGKFPFNSDVENLIVVPLTTRRKIIGHFYVATGTLDTLLVHPREVFRGAIIANAHAIVVAHNHPSGDVSPSEADIRVTRDIIKIGQLMKIQLEDHIVFSDESYCSLRGLGYFHA